MYENELEDLVTEISRAADEFRAGRMEYLDFKKYVRNLIKDTMDFEGVPVVEDRID